MSFYSAALQGVSQYALRNTHYGLNRRSPYQVKPTTPIIYLQREEISYDHNYSR
jgi:hypothetical protein